MIPVWVVSCGKSYFVLHRKLKFASDYQRNRAGTKMPNDNLTRTYTCPNLIHVTTLKDIINKTSCGRLTSDPLIT